VKPVSNFFLNNIKLTTQCTKIVTTENVRKDIFKIPLRDKCNNVTYHGLLNDDAVSNTKIM